MSPQQNQTENTEDLRARAKLTDAIIFGEGIEWTQDGWQPKSPTIIVKRCLSCNQFSCDCELDKLAERMFNE